MKNVSFTKYDTSKMLSSFKYRFYVVIDKNIFCNIISKVPHHKQ